MQLLTLANSATQVMWHQQYHLLYLNFIIGIIEAAILVRWFRAHWLAAYPLLIAANYASSWIAFILLTSNFLDAPWWDLWRPTIENYQIWLIISVALAFLLTVIVEWPIFFIVLRRTDHRFRCSIKACLIAQLVSYITCIGLPYVTLGNVNIKAAVDVESSTEFIPNDLRFWIYYIEPTEGDIWRIRPNGTAAEFYLDADLVLKNDSARDPRLYIEPIGGYSPPDYRWPLSWSFSRTILVLEFALPESAFRNSDGEPTPDSLIVGYSADLQDHPSTPQENEAQWWGRVENYNGLEFKLTDQMPGDPWHSNDADITLAFDTGLGTWRGRNISIIPGDIAIFEFGGQICALDLNKRKLALLRMGYGPVVIRETSD